MSIIKALKKVRNELLRKIKYRKYSIGPGFSSGIRVRLQAQRKLVIGKNFYIGREGLIEADAVIGDNVMFGNRVAVIGKYDHNFQQIGTPTRLAMQYVMQIIIGKGLSSSPSLKTMCGLAMAVRYAEAPKYAKEASLQLPAWSQKMLNLTPYMGDRPLKK